MKYIACDFDEQSEDSIQDAPSAAALAQALFLARECEISLWDLEDGYMMDVYELSEHVATEETYEDWREIDGLELGDPYYNKTGKVIKVRVGLTAQAMEVIEP